MELPTWDILDAFFMQGGDTDCTNNIVRHQIESFNEFIDKQLIQIIQGFNSIQVCHNYNQQLGNFKYKIEDHLALITPIFFLKQLPPPESSPPPACKLCNSVCIALFNTSMSSPAAIKSGSTGTSTLDWKVT